MLTVAEVKDPKRFPPMSFEAKSEPERGSQKPRKDSMCRVRITSLTDGQVIPGGHVIPAGIHEAVVHEKDLPVILAMVESDLELVEAARTAFDRKVKQSIKDEINQLVDKSEDGAEYKALISRAYQQFPGSVAGTFRQFNDRDINPFVSVEVLQKGLVAPAAQAVSDLHESVGKVAADIAAKNAGASADALAVALAQAMELMLSKFGAKPDASNQNNNQKR